MRLAKAMFMPVAHLQMLKLWFGCLLAKEKDMGI